MENPISKAIKRQIRRTITPGEAGAGVIIIIILFLIVLWVLGRRGSYNPDDRDISQTISSMESKKLELYKAPLKKWTETGDAASRKMESLGPFPVSMLDGGWVVKSGIRRFTPDNLYVKINGEAIKFMKEGFQTMHYLTIKSAGGSEEISIELYDQGDERGSIAIFSEYTGGGKMVERRGNSMYIATSAGAIGRSGRFFFRILGNTESGIIRSKSIDIAGAFSPLAGGKKAASAGFRILNEGMKIGPDKIEYAGGNAFQFGFARDFWFGKPDPQKQERLFIHKAGRGENIKELFEKIIAGQAADYKLVSRDGDSALLLHLYLKNYFSIKYKGDYIFGVENMENPERIPGIIEKFAGVVNNEK